MKCTLLAAAAMVLTAGLTSAPLSAAEADACAVSKKYIELLQTKKFDEIGNLYAADAVFFAPTGRTLRGKAEIGNYYKATVSNAGLILRGQNYVGSKTECYFEIWHRSKLNADGKYVNAADGDFHRAAADHFTVNDRGLVVEMVAFPAGSALPLGGASEK
jgi:hypothetical protein